MRNIKTTKCNSLFNNHNKSDCKTERAPVPDPSKPARKKPSNMFEWFEEQMAMPASKDVEAKTNHHKHEECISENKIFYDEILGLASYLRDRKDKEKEISRAIRIVDNKPIESYISIVPSKKVDASDDEENIYENISTQSIRNIVRTAGLLIERNDYENSDILLTTAIKKHPYSLRIFRKYLELLHIQGNRNMFDKIAKDKQTLFSNGVAPTWENFEFTTIKTTKPPEVHSQKKRPTSPTKKTTYKRTYTERKLQREHVCWRQNKIAASN